jgi:recombination protein RecT
MTNSLTTKELFQKNSIQDRFEKLLGKKAPGFISSVLQTVNNNKLLAKAQPETILQAAATAAMLDLPINQNLGFAWIVPYKGQAQFQIGWKGFVQLALRTGQYKSINVCEVFENQFKSFNRLTEELDANFNIEGSGEIVGYASYFKLSNGMEKTCFWSKEAVHAHAKKYSQAYNKSFSPWQDKDQVHAMAKKTVLKNMLSKWGIMSIEMQTAQLTDQSVQEKENEIKYPDNETIDVSAVTIDEETTRIISFLNKATSQEEVDAIKNSLDVQQLEILKSEIENVENNLILTNQN